MASTIVVEEVKGSHVFKIQGYSRIKGLSKQGEFMIRSGSFIVGGHVWHIRLYLDNKWVWFRLQLEKSSAAKVIARYALTVLDETGEPVPWNTVTGAVVFTTTLSRKGRGFELGGLLIDMKRLEESTFLKNYCFRVRCDITLDKDQLLAEDDAKQFVTVPPLDMHHHIGRLLSASSQVEVDITFEVGMETVTAHRLLLAARSPVFMAQFVGPMKESNMHHIRIDDMEARVFKAMLHYMYTDWLPDMDKDEVVVMAQHLLVAADGYDLQRLKLMCQDKLCNYINTSTVTTNLALAEQHGCPGLKEACFEFLKLPGNLKAIMPTDGFQHLITICPSFFKELVAMLAP